MKIIVLDYFEGKILFGKVRKGNYEYYENWLWNKGWDINKIEWMVVNDLKIEEID